MNFQELLSHLGSQQTQIDSLNRLGKQIQESGNRETAQRVQNRLDVMNENWKMLQQRALSDVQDLKFGENIFVQDSETQQPNNQENQIQYPFPYVEQHRQDSPELSDDHYKYQMIYSELFDWLLSCEESLTRQSPAFINADIIKCRLFGLQVSYYIPWTLVKRNSLRVIMLYQWELLLSNFYSPSLTVLCYQHTQ